MIRSKSMRRKNKKVIHSSILALQTVFLVWQNIIGGVPLFITATAMTPGHSLPQLTAQCKHATMLASCQRDTVYKSIPSTTVNFLSLNWLWIQITMMLYIKSQTTMPETLIFNFMRLLPLSTTGDGILLKSIRCLMLRKLQSTQVNP